MHNTPTLLFLKQCKLVTTGLLLALLSGCAVVTVADAAVSVGASVVKVGAAVVATAMDVTAAGVRTVTGPGDKKK